jgi:hypothetical protein
VLYLGGGGERRRSVVMSEGSQASPVRPSVKRRVKLKTLGWLEAVDGDRGRGIL